MHATDGRALRSANQKIVSVDDLIIGMYVSELDRPWLETSFATQGFYLRAKSTIARLQELCEFVYVDPRRYDSSLVDHRIAAAHENESFDKAKSAQQEDDAPCKDMPRERHKYGSDLDFADEIEPAKVALEHAIERVDTCLLGCANGELLDGKMLRDAIEPVVASVLRNKEAASALVRMRSWDDYTYSHSLSCAVWAAVIGKELGYPPEEVETMSLGCAIMDIGKTRIPRELLASEQSLESVELETLRKHVEFGIEIALDSNLADPTIVNIIQSHHERFDGTGYPDGLENSAIPMPARIAGIVDSYDAMISSRPYANAKPSYRAMLELERNADILFQRELVDHFAQAIGIFPVGCVVELNTGEVAIVTKQHTQRRLRPQVMLILDDNKLPRHDLLITDLSSEDDDQGSRAIWIERELPQDSHGIDVSNYFL